MTRLLFFITLLSSNYFLIGQKVHTIHLVHTLKIQFVDTLEENLSHRPMLLRDEGSLDDLHIKTSYFFNEKMGRIQVNRNLEDLRLEIIGGRAYHYGAKREFGIYPDSTTVILRYKRKEFIIPIHQRHTP